MTNPTVPWIVSQANILANVAKSLPKVQALITGASYLIGMSMIFKAIFYLKIYGESRTMQTQSAHMKEPVMYFLIGSFLLYLPSGLHVLMSTTFGYSSPLAYAPVSSSNPSLNRLFGSGSLVGRPLVLIIQTVGLIAFIRGLVLIARAAGQGSQPGGTGKGLVHVFGGILAVNIVGTLQIINNTLYG